MVECQLPKLDVEGSNPFARYKSFLDRQLRVSTPTLVIGESVENRSLFVTVSPFVKLFVPPNRPLIRPMRAL